MYGKCARDITHVPEMCLVETWQVNGSCPFNVPDTFPPVSRGPCPQCGFRMLSRDYWVQASRNTVAEICGKHSGMMGI